jgi:hypothetical protein
MAFQFAKPDFDHTRFIHAQLPDSFPADLPAFGEITDAVVRLKAVASGDINSCQYQRP